MFAFISWFLYIQPQCEEFALRVYALNATVTAEGAASSVSWLVSSRPFCCSSCFSRRAGQIRTQLPISPAVWKKQTTQNPQTENKIARSALKLREDKGNVFGECVWLDRHLAPWEEVAAAAQIQLLLCVFRHMWGRFCAVRGRPVKKASVFLLTLFTLRDFQSSSEVILDKKNKYNFYYF